MKALFAVALVALAATACAKGNTDSAVKDSPVAQLPQLDHQAMFLMQHLVESDQCISYFRQLNQSANSVSATYTAAADYRSYTYELTFRVLSIGLPQTTGGMRVTLRNTEDPGIQDSSGKWEATCLAATAPTGGNNADPVPGL